MKIKDMVLNKISSLVIMFASSATVLACTFLFNEIEIPESLQKQHKHSKF